MRFITVTIRRPGMLAQRFTHMYISTFHAIMHGLDLLGEEKGSVSAWVSTC